MPRHADRGLCCGAGGARMWMEEHIGKRVNHERVEEALDTGAAKIATGCPFCRVMITDGVDDVAAARDVEKAEVLDVAQLLLGSLDQSTSRCPKRARRRSKPRSEPLASRPATAEKADVVEEEDAEDEAPAPGRPQAGRRERHRSPSPRWPAPAAAP